MKFYKVACLIALITFGANANEKASKQSVERLLELTEVSKVVDSIYGQMGGMFTNMGKQMGISQEEMPQFNKYMQKLTELLKQEMSWDTMKQPTMDIYAKHFSQNEINGLIKFYESDIGKSMTSKMPLIMQDSMVMSQNMMMKVMPKIQALAADMKAEIENSRKSTNK